jgi:hypothetical protein
MENLEKMSQKKIWFMSAIFSHFFPFFFLREKVRALTAVHQLSMDPIGNALDPWTSVAQRSRPSLFPSGKKMEKNGNFFGKNGKM